MSSSGKLIVGLVVILITLVQAFVWYAAFVNAGNGSALNFVSFAGTLISIILAVLAIGYTYGESVSQKGKSDSLSLQILTLTDVASGMRAQAEALDKVTKIKEDLEEIANKMESGFAETRERVTAEVRQLMSVKQQAADTGGAVDGELPKQLVVERLMRTVIPVQLMAYWIAIRARDLGVSVSRAFRQEILDGESGGGIGYEGGLNFTLASWFAVLDLGLASSKKTNNEVSVVSVDEFFEGAVFREINKVMKESGVSDVCGWVKSVYEQSYGDS